MPDPTTPFSVEAPIPAALTVPPPAPCNAPADVILMPPLIVPVESWFAVAPDAAPDVTVVAAVPAMVPVWFCAIIVAVVMFDTLPKPTLAAVVPARIVAVESWFAVAPDAAPDVTVEAAVPLMVPVWFCAIIVAAEKFGTFPRPTLAAVVPARIVAVESW